MTSRQPHSTSNEVDILFETITKLKAQGVSMLYISHRLDEIFQIADRVTVIRDGEYVQTADVSKVTRDQLVSWMVGRTLSNLYPKEDVEIGEVVFEARGIRPGRGASEYRRDAPSGRDPRPSGLAGAGRTQLALVLAALPVRDGGEILIEGKRVHISDYRSAMEKGIVYISEDRQKYGLVVPMTVRENITFSLLRQLSGFPLASSTPRRNARSAAVMSKASRSKRQAGILSSTISPAATNRRFQLPKRWRPSPVS